MQGMEGSPIPHSVAATPGLGLHPSSREQKEQGLLPASNCCHWTTSLSRARMHVHTHWGVSHLGSVCHSVPLPATPMEATLHCLPPLLSSQPLSMVKPMSRCSHLQAPHQDRRADPRGAAGHPEAMGSALGVAGRLDSPPHTHLLAALEAGTLLHKPDRQGEAGQGRELVTVSWTLSDTWFLCPPCAHSLCTTSFSSLGQVHNG